jgi:hypothetical protein
MKSRCCVPLWNGPQLAAVKDICICGLARANPPPMSNFCFAGYSVSTATGDRSVLICAIYEGTAKLHNAVVPACQLETTSTPPPPFPAQCRQQSDELMRI